MTKADKKIRADAKLNALDRVLTGPERDELARIARHGSLADLRGFAEAHGVTLSLAAASRTANRLRQAGDRLIRNREAIRALRDTAASQGVTLTQEALDQASLAVTDILDAAEDPQSAEAQKLLLAALPALTGARNSEIAADRVRASREALALAERRLALAEKKLAEAEKVVTATKLTPEQQATRLREIFAK